MLICLIVAGCSILPGVSERTKRTEFLPSSDRSRFSFRAEAVSEGGDDESAEAPLRQWLEEWVQENECHTGYTITTIDRIKHLLATDGGSYRILMQGSCNDLAPTDDPVGANWS